MKTTLTIKVSDIDRLKKKVEKYVDRVGTTAASVIARDLDKEAEVAIRRFYSHYSPRVYERHYYNFMTQSHYEYFAKSKKTYEGGVVLDPTTLDDLYEDPPTIVFENVFAGYHGTKEVDEKYGIPIMPKSPMEIIFERRDILSHKYMKYILAYAQIKPY